MSKFPRITSEDFKNAFDIIKIVLQDPNSLEGRGCQYNQNFKSEIKTAIEELKQDLKINVTQGISDDEIKGMTTAQVLKMAVDGYRQVSNDKEASAASKMNAIKFLREVSQELDDVNALEKQQEQINQIGNFIKQFLNQLVDEKITRDSRSIANEFLNRLKEITNS